MRRSNLNFLTAALVLVVAVVFLFVRRAGEALVWAAIALFWLMTAAIERMRQDDPAQPYAGRKLKRRFSRLLLFWS